MYSDQVMPPTHLPTAYERRCKERGAETQKVVHKLREFMFMAE